MNIVKLLPLFYLIMVVVGLTITWYFNILYFVEGGSVTPSLFFASAFTNNLTTAITIDIYFAALVFSVWVWFESKRHCIKWPLVYIALCFGVGLSVAFPLFLGVRELTLSKGTINGN